MFGNIGTFDARTHPTVHTIEPYGRVSLGAGIGTICLVSCSAVAVQLIADDRAIRLNVGDCLPLNGHQRFIRNPFSRAVTLTVLEDLPVKVSRPESYNSKSYLEQHAAFSTWLLDDADLAPSKMGAVFMPTRGSILAVVAGGGNMDAAILPKASVKYVDLLPTGALAEDMNFYSTDGSRAENVTARRGAYTDLQMGEWIAQTDWKSDPVPVLLEQHDITTVINQDTALICFFEQTRTPNINITVFDAGDWSPEWRG